MARMHAVEHGFYFSGLVGHTSRPLAFPLALCLGLLPDKQYQLVQVIIGEHLLSQLIDRQLSATGRIGEVLPMCTVCLVPMCPVCTTLDLLPGGNGEEPERRSNASQQPVRAWSTCTAWSDFVAARSSMDSDRMGAAGGSCDGFVPNWIIGHTDRL